MEQVHAQNLNAMARFHCSHLASLRNDDLKIIAWKSSFALSLPSFQDLPPSLPSSPSLNPGRELLETRRILRAESQAGARVHIDPFKGGNGSMRIIIGAHTWRT